MKTSRREFLKLSAMGAAGFGLACSASITDKKKRPNILLILTDDQGWGDIGFHENSAIETPVLNQLAKESVRFARFFVDPVCAPTRASLLTGRYHLAAGVSWVTHGTERMNPDEVTFAEVLQQTGYRTGCFGKWHNGAYFPCHPNQQGFDEFVGFCEGHFNNYFDAVLEQNGQSFETEGYISDVLTDQAIDFIQKNRKSPFLCYVPYNAPHSPFQVPDNYFDKYKAGGMDDTLATVYGMVENLDWNIGRLLQTLKDQQIERDTLVIFLTDNGANTDRYDGNMRGRKASVHEGGHRVPCFMRWPGTLPENQEITWNAAHIDVFPTLMSLCGLNPDVKGPLHGRDLSPLLKNADAGWEDRMLFTHQSNGDTVAPVSGAVRTQTYRFTLTGEGIGLYDMINDPEERVNVAMEKPALTEKMHKAYLTWLASVTETLPEFPRPIPVGYAGEGIITLTAPDCQREGDIQFKGKMGWANDWLTEWASLDDSVYWPLQSVREKRVQVELLYACAPSDAGSVIEAAVGRQRVQAQINKGHDPEPHFSPDRVKRKEVYEKSWASLRMGTLTLPEGPSRLTLRALSKPGKCVMELKAVRLLPVS